MPVDILQPLNEICTRLPLPGTLLALQMFESDYEGLSLSNMASRLILLRNSLWVELRQGALLHLNSSETQMMINPLGGWEEEIKDKMPQAVKFIAQANRCRIFEMSAACAYFMISAIEISLRELQGNVRGLRLPPMGAETWGNWLSEFDRFCVKRKVKDRYKRFSWRKPHHYDEVSDIRSYLHSIKDTRDHVGHPSLRPMKTFEPSDLKLIYEATHSILAAVVKTFPKEV